jgi:hypothetical protein
MNGQRKVHGLVGFMALIAVLVGVLTLFASPSWAIAAAAQSSDQGSGAPGLFQLPYIVLALVLLTGGIVGAIWAFWPALEDDAAVLKRIGSL